jgi:uncharacterized protein
MEAAQRRSKLAVPEGCVGTVLELWRYPVKSMLGEQTKELIVTERGATGDRAWALRDLASGRIASAKKFPRLLEFRATYEVEPSVDSRGKAKIETPQGRVVWADDPDTSEVISSILGRPMRLESQPGSHEETGIDRDTVFGNVPVQKFKPEWTSETMPDHFKLMGGSFFEIGPVFLATSGSVQHLRDLRGGSAPIDRRRFRPNIYVDSGPDSSGFAEDAWFGGTLAIGGQVRFSNFQPTIWCVVSTLAQEEQPRDPGILRTIAEHHGGCFGVYAAVSSSGPVRIGDPLVLQK